MAFVYPQVTISAVNYNSYVTVADADTYFGASVSFAAWTALTSDQKARAIVSAVRMLDRQTWQGEKTDPANALQFPRTGLVYPDGSAVDPDTLPQVLIDATCELALILAGDPAVINNPGQGSNIERVKAGSVEVQYFRPTIGTSVDSRLPFAIMELIGFWLASALSVGVGAESTGTCVDRYFEPHHGCEDSDDYGTR